VVGLDGDQVIFEVAIQYHQLLVMQGLRLSTGHEEGLTFSFACEEVGVLIDPLDYVWIRNERRGVSAGNREDGMIVRASGNPAGPVDYL